MDALKQIENFGDGDFRYGSSRLFGRLRTSQSRRPTSSAFSWFESYQAALGEFIGPSVDDRISIDVLDTSHDAFLEFLF